MPLKIVNILCEVGQQLTLLLKEMDKCMRGRKFVGRWEDIFGNGIEDAGVLPEEFNIKDLLRIAETEMLQLRIQPSSF